MDSSELLSGIEEKLAEESLAAPPPQLLEAANALDAVKQLVVKTGNLVADTYRGFLSLEHQHAAIRTWTTGKTGAEWEALQKGYLELIEPLAQDSAVRAAVLALQRSDVEQVHLVVRDMELTKAYPLNRFLVLLLDQCRLQDKSLPWLLHIHFGTELYRFITPGKPYDVELREIQYPTSVTCIYQITDVIVRFGLDKSILPPAQMMGITRKRTKNRRELSNIQQPLWPML